MQCSNSDLLEGPGPAEISRLQSWPLGEPRTLRLPLKKSQLNGPQNISELQASRKCAKQKVGICCWLTQKNMQQLAIDNSWGVFDFGTSAGTPPPFAAMGILVSFPRGGEGGTVFRDLGT